MIYIDILNKLTEYIVTKCKLRQSNTYKKEILEDIFQTAQKIKAADNAYNEVDDPQLIESVIYYQKSLIAKQGYLMRLTKLMGITNGNMPQE